MVADAQRDRASAPVIGILAGEASGDNLGSGLMRALKRRLPDARFVGVGGAGMLDEGLESVFPMDELAVNGFREPILRLPDLISKLLQLRRMMIDLQPAAFIHTQNTTDHYVAAVKEATGSRP